MTPNDSRATRRQSWMRLGLVVVAATLAILVWTVPRQTRFDGSITATGVAFDYRRANDTLLSGSTANLRAQFFASIELPPGLLKTADGQTLGTFDKGLTLTPRGDDAEFAVSEQPMHITEVQLPSDAYVSLRTAAAGASTRLTALLQSPRSAAARSADPAGCSPTEQSSAPRPPEATLTFVGPHLRFTCPKCTIAGTSVALTPAAVQLEMQAGYSPTVYLKGLSDRLSLKVDLSDRELTEEFDACGLRFDDEDPQPARRRSTVARGELFSSAADKGRVEIRSHADVAFHSSDPISVTKVGFKNGEMALSVRGTAEEVVVNDTTVKRSLIDELMTSRAYAAVNLGLVFGLFLLKLFESVRGDALLSSKEES